MTANWKQQTTSGGLDSGTNSGGGRGPVETSSSAAVWGEGSWLFGVMEDANVTSKAVSEVVEVAVAAVAVRVEA